MNPVSWLSGKMKREVKSMLASETLALSEGIDNAFSISMVLNELLNDDHQKTIPVVIYEALCFNVAQGQMNGAPNETRTHSCRFASLAC